ncbi:MAG: hypothetical protein NVV69_00005, partial [Methyloversatilis sp.]
MPETGVGQQQLHPGIPALPTWPAVMAETSSVRVGAVNVPSANVKYSTPSARISSVFAGIVAAERAHERRHGRGR